MSDKPDVATSVQEIDLDIDAWLASPGGDNVLTAPEVKKGASILSPNKEDVTFLDDPKILETPEIVTIADTNQIIESVDSGEAVIEQPLVKSPLVDFLKKRIESKEMFAFDDYDEKTQDLNTYLSSLSEKDVDELWQANVDNIKQEVAANTPKEFFESLPEEMQYAAKYIADGGQDLKGLFKALSQVEEVRELDATKDTDQEAIVKQYLQVTNFGTSEEIDEEITAWKDLGTLEKKAKQFKPKLDQMQEEMVAIKIEEQEKHRFRQQQAAEAYVNNVFEALRPAEINGIKLDKRTQAALYSGLVQPQYPSISGRPTNLLGHLLEKYQYVEPNYPLIAEALWLLSDADSYRASLMKRGGTEAVEKTVRQLKTEQSRKSGSASFENDEDPKQRKLSRPTNIFKR